MRLLSQGLPLAGLSSPTSAQQQTAANPPPSSLPPAGAAPSPYVLDPPCKYVPTHLLLVDVVLMNRTVRVPTLEEKLIDQEGVPPALLIGLPRVGRRLVIAHVLPPNEIVLISVGATNRLLFNADVPSGSFLYQSPTGYCTFPLTGRRQSQQQAWRNCRSCGLVDNVGVCVMCAEICHAGHDLGEERFSNFFCDCGKLYHLFLSLMRAFLNQFSPVDDNKVCVDHHHVVHYLRNQIHDYLLIIIKITITIIPHQIWKNN
jgi:hypothetical protein